MKIADLFHSVQGEGKLLGVPSIFIRTSGCNLRCTWCDTPYASWNPEGAEMSVDEIVTAVRRFPSRHVVLTGGEPLIASTVDELFAELKSDGYHVTIETAGTVLKPLAADLMSISPKLANSTPWEREGGRFAAVHEAHRINLEALRGLMDVSLEFQLKFVVSEEADLTEIDSLLGNFGNISASDILLMPEGTTREAIDGRSGWLAEVCKRRGFRYAPRLHIELFGNTRAT